MHKILIISCLAALALGAPEADADPYYGYYGHGLLAHGNTLVGPGGLSPAWPTTVGLGFQSTVYGARGKRSADPYYGYYGHGLGLGLAHHGGHATSYTHRSPQGLSLRHGLYYGKRSADAAAYHPYGLVLTHNNNVYSGFTGNHYATGLPGRSFAAVTHLGKRSAEPGLFAAGYGFTNGPASVSAVGNHFASNYGVSQLHPGPASSFQRVDRLHKRSADPHGVAVGVGLLNNNVHGLNHHFGTAHGISQLHPGASSSFQQTTRLHKRSAEPFGFAVPIGIRDNNLHGAGGSFIGISQLHPGGHSFQHIDRLRKRSAEPHGFGHFVGIRDNNLLGAHLPVVSSVGVSQLHPGAASSFQHVDRVV